ncbi:MAG: hypothetical protein R3E66_06645 [bacterium]
MRTLAFGILVFLVGCGNDYKAASVETRSAALTYDLNLSQLRHAWINHILDEEDVSIEDYLDETQANVDDLRLFRRSPEDVAELIGEPEDAVAEGLLELSEIEGAFIAEATYPKFGGGFKHVLFGVVTEAMPMAGLLECGKGMLSIEIDTQQYDATCNACGCGNPPPKIVHCTDSSGQRDNADAGCSCWTASADSCGPCSGGECSPCGSGSGVYDIVHLGGILGDRESFWTDPSEKLVYLDNEILLEETWFDAPI